MLERVFSTTACLMPIWCAAVQAQTPDWTIEEFKAQGTIAATATGDQGWAFLNEESNAKNLDLSTVTFNAQDGVYVLMLENFVEIEGEGFPSSNGEAKLNLASTGGKLRIRIKGPTGCANQTRQVSFRIQADANSLAKVEGPDEVRHYYGEGEDQYTTAPAPARSAAASMAVSAGGAASSSDIEHHAPLSGTSDDVGPSTKNLFQTKVTFGIDETALVEIPLSFTSEVSYELAHSGVQEDRVWGHADGRIHVKPDDRSVKLTRAGARGEVVSVLPDGTVVTTGHTRWSYVDRQENGFFVAPWFDDTNIDLSAVIGATQSGTWAPYANLTGVWSPSNSLDRQPPAYQNASHVEPLPQGGALLNEDGLDLSEEGALISVPAGWYGTPSSNPAYPDNQVKVDYALTDNTDGATAKASYVLNLHDEYENLRAGSILVLPRVYNSEYPVKTSGAITWYHDNISRKVTGSITHGWKISPSAGLKLKDLWGLFPEASIGITGEVNGSSTHTVDETRTKNITPGKHCYFYVNIHQEEKYYQLDRYDTDGLAATEDEWIEDPSARGYEAGFSAEYPINVFTSRDHTGSNDQVDLNATLTETEPVP